MRRRKLGAHGPEVSAIGVGAMSFAGFYGPVDEAQSHAILDAALDGGVDHLDTSNVYGMGLSEEIIGRFLNRYRDRGQLPFQIATKAGITRDPDSGARRFDNSAAHLEAELDKSLARLGVEQVALFYVHRREAERPIEEVTETLAALVAKGKIAHIGFSEIAPTSLARADAIHHVAAVQSEYSLQTRQPELGLVQACERLGTALVAFSPVGRGLLTDSPPSAESVAASAFLRTNPRFTAETLARNIEASAPLRTIARDIGASTAAVALAWLLQTSPCVLAIPGTRSSAHFAEIVEGGALTLSPDVLAQIDQHLPVGWAHGARYNAAQASGPEHYC